ncbi:MAG TPA: hypothetical protein DEO89_08675, partial [Lachnospiraceae bacterium]|nr:hypothetical protein [Lachnospiraceae bacterium]
MDNITKSAEKALQTAANLAWGSGVQAVRTEHLLAALTAAEGAAKEILQNNGIPDTFLEEKFPDAAKKMKQSKKDHSSEVPFTPILQKIVEDAGILARHERQKMGTEHLLMALVKQRDTTAGEMLSEAQTNMRKIYMDAAEMAQMDAEFAKTDFMSSREKDDTRRSATPFLDKHAKDLVKEAEEGNLDPVFDRENEIESVMEILGRRTKNNPCILGEPGVGK